MPVAPCFDPASGASGGAAPGGSVQPTLSVSGRVNGEAYTVTSGGRTLTVSNPDGATLLTTVELASTGAAIPVIDSTTTTPSYIAPPEGDFGDAYNVRVVATLDGLTSQVSFTERMAGTPDIPVVNTILDIDWQQLWIDNGSVDVDLSVNGTYTLNGEDYIVDRSTTGQTVTLKSTGLELVQTPGASMDWSIAFGTSLHANAGDNRLLTADMTSTISSALSGSGIGAAAVVGYSQSPNWGSQPVADWVGAGWDINGSTSQDLVCIVRGVARYVDTDRQSPKVNPTSTNHRLFVNGSTYGAAHNQSAAFDGSTLKPVGATYTNGNSDGLALFPPDNRYTGALYCSLWAVGGTGTQMVWTVTRSTWRAWPVPK